MRLRLCSLLLALLLLAPGCRVLAGAALVVGEAFIESALEDDDDDDRDPPKQGKRTSLRRAPAASRDPCR